LLKPALMEYNRLSFTMAPKVMYSVYEIAAKEQLALTHQLACVVASLFPLKGTRVVIHKS